jgi:hypothetical protein
MTEVGPAIVSADGDLYIYSTADRALARVWMFEQWTAYDTSGRRLVLTGGSQRVRRLGPLTVATQRGRRLRPSGDDAARPEVVAGLIARHLPDDPGDMGVDELVALCVEHRGWDD